METATTAILLGTILFVSSVGTLPEVIAAGVKIVARPRLTITFVAPDRSVRFGDENLFEPVAEHRKGNRLGEVVRGDDGTIVEAMQRRVTFPFGRTPNPVAGVDRTTQRLVQLVLSPTTIEILVAKAIFANPFRRICTLIKPVHRPLKRRRRRSEG